jgi:L-serine dehydratase
VQPGASSRRCTAKASCPARHASVQSCSVRLGATGHGHGSYNAVLWGLEGEDPETVDTTEGPLRADQIKRTGELRLNGTHPVVFDPEDDLLLYRRRSLPFHPNGMIFTAHSDGKVLCERTYYSIGGGFVLDDDESGHPQLLPDPTVVPYPFRTGTELLDSCRQQNPQRQRGHARQRMCTSA